MNKPKSALILGGAKCVFQEYERAVQMHQFDTVIAVNDIGIEIEGVNHWCTMHPEKMGRWMEARRDKGFKDPDRFWTSSDRVGRIPQEFPIEFQTIRNTRGGSGLLAVFVARYLQYDKKVLCGIPLLGDQEHFHKSGYWKEVAIYRSVWDKYKDLKEDVRSFSGWTLHKYGEPTIEWLAI